MGMSAGTASDDSHRNRSESVIVDSDRASEDCLSSMGMDADASGQGQQDTVLSSGAAGVMLSAADGEGESLWQYIEEAAPHVDSLQQAVGR